MTAESQQQAGWHAFIEGCVYSGEDAPWRDDPAFALITDFPGLRDSVGGDTRAALVQAVGLVQAMAGQDMVESIGQQRPANGLSLGFGTNALEPVELLRIFELDRVHGVEWIGEQVIQAAQFADRLRAQSALQPDQLRLHHGSMCDLSALPDNSIRVIYAANVFNYEIPMSQDTFDEVVKEITRVLALGGIMISRGSAGLVEDQLARSCRILLRNPLVSVLQKV